MASQGNHGQQEEGWVPTGWTVADSYCVEEGGRTFNAYRDGTYHLPNDGKEQDRLDIQHQLWLLMLNWKLGLAPMGEPKYVLDIATGTGRWAKDFAHQYPNSHVIGTDISLIQHPNDTPPNCEFIREDAEDEWLFDVPFDYVHLRTVAMCFEKPHEMPKRIFNHMRPGGWVEYQEYMYEAVGADEHHEHVLSTHPHSIREMYRTVCEGQIALGKVDPRPAARNYKKWMEEAGFINVTFKEILTPMNRWPVNPNEKALGAYYAKDMVEAIETAAKLIKTTGLTEAETQDFVKGTQDFIKNQENHVYIPWAVVYGQKPLDAPEAVVHRVRSGEKR